MTSIVAKPRMNRAAFDGDVLRRCSSLNSSHCGPLPPGMKRAVNTCRNDGSSLPHPSSARWGSSSAARRSSSVRARATRAVHVAAVEHERADPLGMAGRVLDGDGGTLRHAEEREPLEPGRVDDGGQVLDPRVELNAVVFQSDSPQPRSS